MNGEAMPFSYCVSCFENAEQSVVDSIKAIIQDAVVLVPMLERLEKHNGQWERKQIKLTPGYVMIYYFGHIPVEKIISLSNVNRVLFYYEDKVTGDCRTQSKVYELIGEDRRFAEWIYRNNGVIGVSKAVIENGSFFSVIEGPLKEFCGSIKRLDKHNRKALVRGLFNNNNYEFWMSFDWA